jgi:hypothetical protein
MKRSAIFLPLLTLSIFTLAARAQNNGAPPRHQMLSSPDAFADGHLAALDKQVGLSPDQKGKARAVFL